MSKAKMLAKLSESGLDAKDAAKLKMKLVTDKEARRLTNRQFNETSMLIPYFDVKGKVNKEFWRLRRLETPKGFKKKHLKYTQTPDTPPIIYFPPLLSIAWSEIVKDTSIPIFITEGELKAASGCKLLREPVLGLGGVWSWKSKKTQQPIIKDVLHIEWVSRTVYIVFDSDTVEKPDVGKALAALTTMLAKLGAVVFVITIPHPLDGTKAGLDDYLVANGTESFDDLVSDAEPHSLSSELWKLNDKVTWIRDNACVVEHDTKLIMTNQQFINNYAPYKYFKTSNTGAMVEVSATKSWREWLYRSEVFTVDYSPGEGDFIKDFKGNNAYNLWEGWGVEPVKGPVKYWDELLTYIFEGNKEARLWFEQWCAFQFQNPGNKIYSAVLLWGTATGTGKSLVGMTLGKIFGENFSEVGQKHLHSDYNEWAWRKQFVLGNELTGVEKRKDADHIKNMITQERVYVNIKYGPQYNITDCINYFFTSNHPDAFILEDQDRRFFVWEMPPEPLPRSFYAGYDEWLHSNGPSHLFDYMLNFDLTGFDHKSPPPITEAKIEMMVAGKSDVSMWVHELINNPEMVLKIDRHRLDQDIFTMHELYRLYNPTGNSKVTINGLSRELTKAGLPKSEVVRLDDGANLRLRVVRNIKKWQKKQISEWAKHYTECTSNFVHDAQKNKGAVSSKIRH